MANAVVIQFAVFSASAAVLVLALIIYKRRKAQSEPARNVPQITPAVEKPSSMQPKPAQAATWPKLPDVQPQRTETIPMETAGPTAPLTSVLSAPSSPAPPKPKIAIDVQTAVATQEDRNERILAGISENIRKSLQSRPVAQHSPIPYAEAKPRNTEYVRVKKEIITPHGQIRFSILKDWMSINMLAVFRRASLDWKTPDDLIAFLPAYLEPEAEILNNQVLLIGTPGHNEKLAVPIRSLDASSRLRDCFDFVGDVRTATNTPAVLLPFDADFEVVSRGVITQTVFTNAVEEDHTEVTLLRSTEALQKNYSAALRRMESTV